jgi:secondary thiamine-phosphate synthase enzyme
VTLPFFLDDYFAERRTLRLSEGLLHVASHELTVATGQPMQFLDITDRLARAPALRRGLIHVSCLHTTAALLVGEYQDALLHDMRACLHGLVSAGADYRHNRPEFSDCDRGNAAAHLRAMLLQPSISLAVADGRPVLGRWQRVLLVELDGPRERRLHVQAMGVAA